ncbi:MAG: hypothetical protein GF331_10185 [Chitinivibrionales bacterium]|nr:hypothetical protein [Chitinivibrionales bacterium]
MNRLRGITLGAVLGCMLSVAAAYGGAWPMKPLRLDGGGWVTGMVIHPAVPGLMYVRTDVGGANTWDSDQQVWRPITDWIPVNQETLYGIDAIALDVNDPDVLYLAMGRSRLRSLGKQIGNIYRSDDRGKTFSPLRFPAPGSIDGNNHAYDQGRSTGERLAVNPFNSSELIMGCYVGGFGLWQTKDTGMNWTRLDIPGVADNAEVVMLVHYDRLVENRIYAFVQDVGVFVSLNNGASWGRLKTASGRNCPATFVRRMEQGSDGAIYFTNRKSRPFAWKIVDNKAYDITPTAAELATDRDNWVDDKGFHGVAVNPSDPRHVIMGGGLASSRGPIPLYETKDGGETWRKLPVEIGYSTPWAGEEIVLKNTVSDLIWDPHRTDIVYHLDGSGMCAIDLSVSPARADEMADGIEETVCFEITSVPFADEERIFSAFSDVAGFYHDNGLDRPPSHPLHDYWLGSSGRHTIHSIHYCAAHPERMYATGRGNYVDGKDRAKESGYYAFFTSNDGGITWQRSPNLLSSPPYAPWTLTGDIQDDINPLEIQVSSTNPDNVVMVGKNPVYSKDGATTWHSCSGLADLDLTGNFTYTQTLAADPIEGDVFYAACPTDTKSSHIYRSTNGGADWTKAYSDLPWAKYYLYGIALKALPGRSGDLWLNLYDNGLWHSTDGGDSWSQIDGFSGGPGVGMARVMDAGVGPSDDGAIFVLGQYHGANGLWVSTDGGNQWTNVAPADVVLANCKTMEASSYEYGKVYCGTTGAGMRYFSASDASTGPVVRQAARTGRTESPRPGRLYSIDGRLIRRRGDAPYDGARGIYLRGDGRHAARLRLW